MDPKKDVLQNKLDQIRETLKEIEKEEERNLLSYLKNNLSIVGRVTFLHRIIYLGEHTFSSEKPGITLKQFMAANIAAVHGDYCDELLTGICISYPNHLVHLIEGSEETLMRHLRLLYRAIESGESRFSGLKLVVVCHHIKQRFFMYWTCEVCKPPTTTEKIDMSAENVVAVCLKLCVRNFAELAECCKQQYKIAMRPGLPLTDRALVFLPDMQLVEFLMQVKTVAIRDLLRYVENYRRVPWGTYYHERVWPAGCDYIPYNPYDVDEESPLKQDATLQKRRKK